MFLDLSFKGAIIGLHEHHGSPYDLLRIDVCGLLGSPNGEPGLAAW
jgi:hypothetical protein